MRGGDILHFDGQAYWQRIMDPDQTPLKELRAKEQQKRGEIDFSNFGIAVGAAGAVFTMGGSILLALGATRNLAIAKQKHALIVEAIRQRTPTKDIDHPSTPEEPQASTPASAASTSSALPSTSASSPPPYSATDSAEALRSNGAQGADWFAGTAAELTPVRGTNEGNSPVLREGGANSVGSEPPSELQRGESVEVLECGICMEDMKGRAVAGAPCGHTLCRDCRVLIVKAATAKGRLARCHFWFVVTRDTRLFRLPFVTCDIVQ